MHDERLPTLNERSIIQYLVRQASLLVPDDYFDHLRLKKVGEKNMATLHLITPYCYQNRAGSNIANELTFTDLDGVDVLVTLLTNRYGEPTELDIWKLDGTAVIDLPSVEEINVRKMIGRAFSQWH